uniref:Arf-GAP domain-containing protein n=1 Tax=Seriola lalandi dorsalis TaxID=1841481 RepID=A0A3B4XNW1_SERLL
QRHISSYPSRLLSVLLSADPGWGSCSLGVFICLACSGIHRNIPDISKVKSLSLSRWEDHEMQNLETSSDSSYHVMK